MSEFAPDSKIILLPCPFCGAIPTVEEDFYRSWVECHGCKAEGPYMSDSQGHTAYLAAVLAWNTRVAPVMLDNHKSNHTMTNDRDVLAAWIAEAHGKGTTVEQLLEIRENEVFGGKV